MANMAETQQRIESLIQSDRVVLFMKGNRRFPQCGFSAAVVQCLDAVLPEYTTVDVLSDPGIRQGIKDYSSWPTIPQLYIEGEFIGGCDIVREMFAAGDLHEKLGVTPEKAEPPAISVSDRAAEVLKQALSEGESGDVVHLSIDERFRHSLGLGPKQALDVTVRAGDVTIAFDATSAKRAGGLSIDFVDGPSGQGFKIDNPNEPPKVVELAPAELKAKLDSGEIKELFDVRTPEERDKAKLGPGRLLDDDAVRYIEGLDRDTPIAFFCHHGTRSQAAADHFREQGFRKVYNLAGGIDAWSREVDPDVPRYQ